jgi:hypothetical protein
MAETYWPFDGVDTTETQFSQWSRNIGEGVKGSFNTTDLKVTAPGTGMTVSVAAGQALVRGHYYYNDAAKSLAITTANATNPRIDTVVLELDPTANTIVAKVVAGTAAASPVAPTLTQTDSAVYQLPIAYVAVAAATGTISSGNVTDARTFLGQGWFSTPVQDKSANYTIVAGDKFSTIRSTGSAITVTIANVLAVGERIDFLQDGSGQITFAAGSGVTLQAFSSATKTAGQYAAATVECVASGQYRLIGNVA